MHNIWTHIPMPEHLPIPMPNPMPEHLPNPTPEHRPNPLPNPMPEHLPNHVLPQWPTPPRPGKSPKDPSLRNRGEINLANPPNQVILITQNMYRLIRWKWTDFAELES